MKIITGRAACRTDDMILGSIRDRVREDPLAGIVVIVPPQYSFSAKKKILSMTGKRGCLSPDVVSPESLVTMITDKVYGRTLDSMDDSGRCMLFCRILSSYRDELPRLSSNSARAEIASGLSDLIEMFQSMDITADMIGEYVSDDSDFDAKLKEVSFVFEKFEEYTREGKLSQQDLMNIAIDHIGECEDLKHADVYVLGFDVFSEQMIRFLSAVDSAALSMTVSMLGSSCYSGDEEVFYYPSYYTKLFKDMGAEIVHVTEAHADIAPEIADIERYVFSYPFERCSNSGNVSVCCCDNRDEEAAACCEQISWFVESGYDFRDIAVVAADISSYKNYIKKYFGAAHIPYFLDEKRILDENPVSIFILSALKLCIGRLDRYRLTEHIKCGILGSEYDRELIEDIINSRISNIYRLREPFENEREERARQKCVVPVLRFIEKARKVKKHRRLVELLKSYLKESGCDEFTESVQHRFIELKYIDAAEYFPQIPEDISTIFEQAMSFDIPADIRLLYDMLKSAMSKSEIGIIPVLSNSVFCCDVKMVRLPDVKAVLILGANDGILPDYEEEAGIFSFGQKQELMRNMTSQPDESRIFSEKLSCYKFLTAPSRKLCVFYHRQDGPEIVNLMPSFIVQKLEEMFPVHEMRAGDIIGSRLKSNALFLAKGELGRRYNGLPAKHPGLLELIESGETSDDFNACTGYCVSSSVSVLDRAIAEKLYSLRGSSSMITSYYECPYRFFMRYGITPAVQQSPDMGQNDVGNYVHAVLDAYAHYLMDNNLSIREVSQQEMTGQVRLIEEQVAGSCEKYTNSNANMMVLRSLEEEILNVLLSVKTAKCMSDSDITESEYRFDVNAGGAEITGSIDRIDVADYAGRRYYSVVDYKTGSENRFSLEDFVKGLRIQLPLYLLAVKKKWPDAEAAGAGYVNIGLPAGDAKIETMYRETGFHVDDAGVLGRMYGNDGKRLVGIGVRVNADGSIHKTDARGLYTGEEINSIVRYAEKLVTDASAGIKEGNIAAVPNPDSSGNVKCGSCDFRMICGHPQEVPESEPSPGREQLMDDIRKAVENYEI